MSIAPALPGPGRCPHPLTHPTPARPPACCRRGALWRQHWGGLWSSCLRRLTIGRWPLAASRRHACLLDWGWVAGSCSACLFARALACLPASLQSVAAQELPLSLPHLLACRAPPQVHRATLQVDGRLLQVAVKVRHPGCARAIWLDFQLLRPLAALTARVRSLRVSWAVGEVGGWPGFRPLAKPLAGCCCPAACSHAAARLLLRWAPGLSINLAPITLVCDPRHLCTPAVAQPVGQRVPVLALDDGAGARG